MCVMSCEIDYMTCIIKTFMSKTHVVGAKALANKSYPNFLGKGGGKKETRNFFGGGGVPPS